MADQKIIEEVERYASRLGLSPSTVCVRATGNSRLLLRIARRIEQTEFDVVRLRDYMAQNPPPENAGAAQ